MKIIANDVDVIKKYKSLLEINDFQILCQLFPMFYSSDFPDLFNNVFLISLTMISYIFSQRFLKFSHDDFLSFVTTIS